MTDTTLVPIRFEAGIDKNSTPYFNKGKWIDCDKVRFRYGRPEKIGGWVRETVDGSQEGVARDILTWLDLDTNNYIGIGTNTKLYINQGGRYNNITPIRRTVENQTGGVSTIAGSSLIQVEITAHTSIVGDTVIISAASGPVGGNITLDGNYVVQSVQDTNTFTIDAGINADTTSTNPAVTHTFAFEINTGGVSSAPALGWGAGRWGEETWGTPRSQGVTIPLRQWSLVNWGEDLLANPDRGGIYWWDATNGVAERANLITEAPEQNHTILVAQPTRHLVSFGCSDFNGDFDPLLVRWSDSEDFTTWQPATDNQAGSQLLMGGNRIVGAVQSRRETLIFTDDSVHTMRFIGGQFVFAFDRLGNNAGLVSTHGAVDVNGIVFWMGRNSFFVYDGTMRTLPCTLQKAIFDPDMEESYNEEQADKIYAGINAEFHEVWWLYPSRDSEEIDRYVCFNYLENIWYDGTIDRTVWADADIFERPYAISSAGTLFIHEEGKNDDASPMFSFLQSGEIELETGENMVFTDRFVPDFRMVGTLDLIIKHRKYPQEDYQEKGPYAILPNTRKINVRVRGRELQVRYESDEVNGDFEVGSPRLGIQQDGER